MSIKSPLGTGAGAAAAAADYQKFQLNDEFTSGDMVAGTPRQCTPGPGYLHAVETDGGLAISGGEMVYTAPTSAGYRELYYYGSPMHYIPGITAIIKRTINATGTTSHVVGWWASANFSSLPLTPSGGSDNGTATILLSGTGINPSVDAENASAGTFAATTYRMALMFDNFVTTGNRFHALIKGGAFTEWTLLYPLKRTTGDVILGYPYSASYNMAGTADYFRVAVPASPLNAAWGLATAYNASGSANDTITHLADGFVEATWQAVTNETFELSIRRTDDNNRWVIRGSQSGSTIKIIEINASVETERASAAQTWTNGTSYRIVARAQGTEVAAYISNTRKVVYTSATFNQTATGGKTSHSVTYYIAWPYTLPASPAAALDAVAE